MKQLRKEEAKKQITTSEQITAKNRNKKQKSK